ncbi:DEAD/DEAH box RNA helicase [Rhizophagus clarus]|uniref:ATP-dependent RNA helicase DED1 n=1 Tax=Rhizophagus clarus TaxID=94130 RepID=A0A8H3KWC0_9GLOM|nr:DEAD/DEAH box RNA helicase [Rhizophagus clarus]
MGDESDKRIGKWGPRQKQHVDPNRQWAAQSRRYEWKDTYDDDIAPPDPELEKELFGEDNHVPTGINFSKYQEIKVTVTPERTIRPVESFNEADLHSVMKENIRLAKYSIPTPVQKYSIPIITDGNDLMACAQTGSGKTAAFLIPTLSKLFGKAKKLAAPRPQSGARRFKAEPLVLIIAPTRELATQIFDECRRFTYRSMMRPCVVYGGAEVGAQKAELAKGCDVLTATPGRLNDFLERGIVSLRRVKYLVLDEADRMLDMGFETDIRKIVQKSDLCDDGTRQTLMFSATFPNPIRKLAADFLAENFFFLKVGRVGGTTSDITQKIMYVEDQNKRNSLVELLLKQPPSRTLIFVETKRGADSLDDFLYNQNFPTTSIHGDRNQREREDALIAFKTGKSPILIATAVAARGLDIKNVMHVINYDLCNEIDEYVHRIGRTARVGNKGLATTFYNEKNSDIAPNLVKILLECGQEVPNFLQTYAPSDNNLNFDDDDRESNTTTSNYTQNTRDNNRYGNWDNGSRDNGSNQRPAWDTGRTTQWDNNNRAAGNNNYQTGWDNSNNRDNPAPNWDSSRPSWETSPPQNQQPVQNMYNTSQQPPYQSYQQPQSQSFQQPPQPQPSYSQPQVNVNLPRTNNQYDTTPQQTYGYNTQASQRAPSHGAGGYNSPPNDNNSQQNYYRESNDNNIRNQRNPRRKDEINTPSPNSDSWGSAPKPQSNNEEWNPNKVPWE